MRYRYLRLDHILRIHEPMIERFGGDPHIRDLNLIDSAVAQPKASFGGQALYPTLVEKAAALGFSLTKNHGFVDGNKRTAAAAVEMFLLRNGHEIRSQVDEHEAIYLRLAASLLSREQYLLDSTTDGTEEEIADQPHLRDPRPAGRPPPSPAID